MYQYLALSVIIITVIFDSLRDGFMQHKKNNNNWWWQWHIVKWIQFYVPLLFILIIHVNRKWWVILSIFCWILWQLTLRYVAGVKWESIWIRWLKKLLPITK